VNRKVTGFLLLGALLFSVGEPGTNSFHPCQPISLLKIGPGAAKCLSRANFEKINAPPE